MTKIAILSSNRPDAQSALDALKKTYEISPVESADIIVVLGGDGFMLRALHDVMNLNKPIFGMNCGSVGFLMNTYKPENLKERLQAAKQVRLSPLQMTVTTLGGNTHKHHAINEVSLFRSSALAGHPKNFCG